MMEYTLFVIPSGPGSPASQVLARWCREAMNFFFLHMLLVENLLFADNQREN
jgi:hypothetical protein